MTDSGHYLLPADEFSQHGDQQEHHRMNALAEGELARIQNIYFPRPSDMYDSHSSSERNLTADSEFSADPSSAVPGLRQSAEDSCIVPQSEGWSKDSQIHSKFQDSCIVPEPAKHTNELKIEFEQRKKSVKGMIREFNGEVLRMTSGQKILTRSVRGNCPRNTTPNAMIFLFCFQLIIDMLGTLVTINIVNCLILCIVSSHVQ